MLAPPARGKELAGALQGRGVAGAGRGGVGGVKLGAEVLGANSSTGRSGLQCPGRRESAGFRSSLSGCSRRSLGLAGVGSGLLPPLRPLSPPGAGGRLRSAGCCLHFAPESHDREEEEQILTPGKGRRSTGVNKPPSCCQSVS